VSIRKFFPPLSVCTCWIKTDVVDNRSRISPQSAELFNHENVKDYAIFMTDTAGASSVGIRASKASGFFGKGNRRSVGLKLSLRPKIWRGGRARQGMERGGASTRRRRQTVAQTKSINPAFLANGLR